MHARLGGEGLVVLTLSEEELPVVDQALMNGLVSCDAALKRVPLTEDRRREFEAARSMLQQLGDTIATAVSHDQDRWKKFLAATLSSMEERQPADPKS